MAVKGISRQVIVVQSPDPNLFDQAIFILNENAVTKGGVSEEELLREAKQLLWCPDKKHKMRYRFHNLILIAFGASFMGAIWLLTVFF